MQSEWQDIQAFKSVASLLTDRRPAWLWSADGKNLLWSNAASTLFAPKARKKVGKDVVATPIGGQVARALRLGSVGRSSLSRMQFLLKRKPVSATCLCTPLTLADDKSALLVVGVDPVEGDFDLKKSEADLSLVAPDMSHWRVIGSDGELLAQSDEQPDDLSYWRLQEFDFGPDGCMVGLYLPAQEPAEETVEVTPETDTDEDGDSEDDTQTSEPEHSGDPVDEAIAALVHGEGQHADENTEAEKSSLELTNRFDRLADDEALFSPLNDEDDEHQFDVPEIAEVNAGQTADADEAPLDATQPETITEAASSIETVATEPAPLWKITGRGFLPHADSKPEDSSEPELDEEFLALTAVEAAELEQESRYNFDELSRILTDRVSRDDDEPVAVAPPPRSTGGDLVTLGDENLILNRLPLGLLVFRDQEVLFANRALVDLTGYPDVASVRDAGLAAIFPDSTDDGEPVGPVDQLVRADGDRVAVHARLQSISWRGNSALLLSARQKESAPADPVALRVLAKQVGEGLGHGFVVADKAGLIREANDKAGSMMGPSREDLVGHPLDSIVHISDVSALRNFLEQPAQMAGSPRPNITVRSRRSAYDVVIFTEGNAGIVSGYFGYVRARTDLTSSEDSAPDRIDPSLLGRVSRGVRRPLNTIVGFAELIRSGAFGPTGNSRYTEYASDIRTAGNEIAGLIDELDDFTRLSEGSYKPDSTDLDLGELLDHCLNRIRPQASAMRVFVRSAISETLPRIKADRASLAQAILNLLASAIDQTPAGGQVVLSAQREADGSVGVHVRDSAQTRTALEERFVMFREDGDHSARPNRSSVGLALTRSLLAINACSLSFDPAAGDGTLVSLIVPADAVVSAAE